MKKQPGVPKSGIEAGKYPKSALSIQRILRAARTCFTSKSYAEVTMAELAAAAGMTKGGLYHHFSAKEDLYLEMMFDYLQEQKTLMEAAAEKGRNCREKMRLLTIQFMRQPPLAHRMMRLVRRDINIFRGEARRRLVEAYQAALPQLEERMLEDGMRRGEIPAGDPRLLSWLHAALIETVLSDYAEQVMGGPEERTDYVSGIFFDGLQAVGSRDTNPGRS